MSVGLVLGGVAFVFGRGLRRRRAAATAAWTAGVGLEPGERVIEAWRGERYFGPLVEGSGPSLGMRLRWLLHRLNLLGWYVHQGPPARFHGTQVWLRVTDQDRLVVMAEGRRVGTPRPVPRSPSAARRPPTAPVQLLASGPGERAAVRSAAEVGMARDLIERSRPDRPRKPAESRWLLAEIAPAGDAPLLVWVERGVFGKLKAWAEGEPALWGAAGSSLEVDLATIAGADTLELNATTNASDLGTPKILQAYERIRAAGGATRSELEALVRSATPAGRVYAALLLRGVDPQAGRRAFAALRRDHSPVTQTEDGMIAHSTVADVLAALHTSRRVDPGGWPAYP